VSASLGGIPLPELRVLAMKAVVLHEDADERRVLALSQRLQAEGVVKNPPIVASLGDDRYVVLDGANRVSALRRIGVPDIVVQLVDYETVRLSTWFHLITGADSERLSAALAGIDGLKLRRGKLADARQALALRESLAYLVLPDGGVLELLAQGSLGARTEMLRRAVAVYKGRANIHRVQSDEIEALSEFYDEIAGLIVFPSYQPGDIIEMARQDAKLPSGITRHVIPLRALRINTELGFLWSDQQASEKNRWLAEWTRHKVQQREIRHYEEQTVIYDE
jgi:hypothetical protein